MIAMSVIRFMACLHSMCLCFTTLRFLDNGAGTDDRIGLDTRFAAWSRRFCQGKNGAYTGSGRGHSLDENHGSGTLIARMEHGVLRTEAVCRATRLWLLNCLESSGIACTYAKTPKSKNRNAVSSNLFLGNNLSSIFHCSAR